MTALLSFTGVYLSTITTPLYPSASFSFGISSDASVFSFDGKHGFIHRQISVAISSPSLVCTVDMTPISSRHTRCEVLESSDSTKRSKRDETSLSALSFVTARPEIPRPLALRQATNCPANCIGHPHYQLQRQLRCCLIAKTPTSFGVCDERTPELRSHRQIGTRDKKHLTLAVCPSVNV
jgi:hypothetical protein